MNQKHNLIAFLLSLLASVLYLFTVPPDITKSYSITGFFVLIMITLFFGLKGLLLRKIVSTTNMTPLVLSLGVIYLVALSTLNSLRLVDVAVVVVVEFLVIAFVVKPTKRV